jgi:KDO2-lipid IV(A) lauroyltransferase
MLVTGMPKVGEPLRFRCEVTDVIRPEEYAGRPDAVRAITERFTAGLERLVRRHPEQYFWLHRRWKHQPAVKKGKQAVAAA